MSEFSELDPVLLELQRLGTPPTRETYLALAYPDADPSRPLPAEQESELPREFQLSPAQESDFRPDSSPPDDSPGSEGFYPDEVRSRLKAKRQDLTSEEIDSLLSGVGF